MYIISLSLQTALCLRSILPMCQIEALKDLNDLPKITWEVVEVGFALRSAWSPKLIIATHYPVFLRDSRFEWRNK